MVGDRKRYHFQPLGEGEPTQESKRQTMNTSTLQRFQSAIPNSCLGVQPGPLLSPGASIDEGAPVVTLGALQLPKAIDLWGHPAKTQGQFVKRSLMQPLHHGGSPVPALTSTLRGATLLLALALPYAERNLEP